MVIERWRARGGKGKARYVGVKRHGRKWHARIMENGERTLIGCYLTEEEAARAYDRQSVRIRGYAVNFKEGQ
jgi:hypothetical protein